MGPLPHRRHGADAIGSIERFSVTTPTAPGGWVGIVTCAARRIGPVALDVTRSLSHRSTVDSFPGTVLDSRGGVTKATDVDNAASPRGSLPPVDYAARSRREAIPPVETPSAAPVGLAFLTVELVVTYLSPLTL